MEYKLAETVSPSHNLKMEEAIERIVSLELKQEEMLRLHYAMVGLVTNLVNLLSPDTSLQSPPVTPVSPGNDSCHLEMSSPPPPLLHTERKEQQQASLPSYLPSGQSTFLHTKQEPSEDTERKEQLCLPTKEGRKKDASCTRKDSADTDRKEQQQHIERLAAYIDGRAAHYSRGRLTSTPEPYPRVDWGRINPHTRRNLPQPIQLPVSGCPQDPNIYPDSPNPKGRVMECYRPTTQCFIPGCEHTECLPPAGSTTKTSSGDSSSNTFNAVSRNEKGTILLNKAYKTLQITSCPFGTAAGFETNLGVVAPPVSPIGGYIYTEKGWKLHATPG